MPEDKVGRVTHFFGRPMVAAVLINAGSVKIGDRLRFKGYTTDFETEVTSLQEAHQTIAEAVPGQHTGIQVPEKARPGDLVYKLT
jgi:translation elongation factor EF-1alpha